MTPETIVAVAILFLIVALIAATIHINRPKKLDRKVFQSNWRELQKYCRNKDTWPTAMEKADKLLDKALKKRKFKGDSMGERMVSAQNTFTDNDGVWYAHNLYKKIINNPHSRIKESEIKDALFAYRQSLRDLGALPNARKNKPLKVEK